MWMTEPAGGPPNVQELEQVRFRPTDFARTVLLRIRAVNSPASCGSQRQRRTRLGFRESGQQQYQNTMKIMIRDKSHSKTPLHSIVAEIANAMTSAGQSGRRGISPATGPASSAWLRSRTVMSIGNISAPDETPDRHNLSRALPLKTEIVLVRIGETVLSHNIWRNKIAIRRVIPIRWGVDAIYAWCCRWASVLYQVVAYA